MRDIAWTRPDEGTPLYLQLARSLREHISSGGIDPGSALPSERDLSEMAGLSRVTVPQGHRATDRRRRAGAQAGVGHVRRAADRDVGR